MTSCRVGAKEIKSICADIRTDGHRGRTEIASYSSPHQSMRAGCSRPAPSRSRSTRTSGAVIFGADGKSEVVATDLVIGADGIGSAVARLVGAQVLWEGRHASSVVYGHCSGLDAAGYSWYYREGVSAGIIPTNG